MARSLAQIVARAVALRAAAPQPHQLQPLQPDQVHLGLLLDDGFWRVVKATPKTVTIASAGRGGDPGARFRGRRYMYRWDGTGYKRQGQYLYAPGGSGNVAQAQIIGTLPHPSFEYLYVEILADGTGRQYLGRVVDHSHRPMGRVLTVGQRAILQRQVLLQAQDRWRQEYAQYVH